MIYIKCMGGLGNQLFQIFAGISCSINNQTDFSIIKIDRSPSIFKSRPIYWDSFFESIKSKLIDKYRITKNIKIHKELCFNYHEIPIHTDILLDGYFQSYKYFINNYDKISNILNIENNRSLIRQKYNKIYDFDHSISIHFRGTDYLKLPNIHPILPVLYYEKSIELLNSMFDLSKYIFILFYESSDNEWIDSILSSLSTKINYCKINQNISDWEQLLIMSNCNHHIIANSTFSWWGAYINTNTVKKVMSPHIEHWFGSKGPDLTQRNDLIPNNWIQINW